MSDGVVQPLSLTQLLDEALKLARRHFRKIYLPVAIPLALGSALIPLGQVAFFRGFAFFEPGVRPDFAGMLPGMVAFAALMAVALAILGLGNAALMAGVTYAGAGRDVSMAEAWRSVVRLPALGTFLLALLLTGLGLVCCLVPGLYLMLLFCPLVAVMTEERRFGPAALGRCRELMGFNPAGGLGNHPCFKAFVVLFVGGLLGSALSFLVQLPLVVVQQVVMLRSLGSGSPPDPGRMMSLMAWISVPSQMLGMLVQTGVRLYTSFGLVLLYFDLRRQKEGGDLESAIRSLSRPEAVVLPDTVDDAGR